MSINSKINNVYSPLGASSHSLGEREKSDFYATNPIAIKLLLENEQFTKILEPACGQGHLSKPLIEAGYEVDSYDLVDRGYGKIKDFFDIDQWDGDIITNPPYSIAQKFVEHSLDIIKSGAKAAFFLRLLFLEGKARKKLFLGNPPKVVYVCSGRIKCAKNGDFENQGESAMAFAWFVWEKGYKGETVVRWIN